MTTPPPKPSLTVDTGSGTMNSPVSSDEPNSTFFTPYGSSRGDDDEADEDRFLQRVFESTDAACQGFVHSGCDTRLDDQFDTFMNCRSPMSFLSFLKQRKIDHGTDTFEVMPAGAYVVPRFCEYCGAEDIDDCGDDCKRPKLYFQKKRPPFARKDPLQWDERDFAVDPEQPTSPPEPQTTGSFLSFFTQQSQANENSVKS